MAKLIGVVIVLAAIVGGYFFVQSSYSGGVKDQVLSLVNKMDLTDNQRDSVRDMVDEFHEAALDKAGGQVGAKLDADLYLDSLFDAMVEKVRSRDERELADKLVKERSLVSITVR